MRKLNLLYCITKLELGGAQKQLFSLIRHLDRAQFNIFLFTAADGMLLPEAISTSGLTLKKSRCLERAINPLKDILACLEIYRFIRKNRIDLVHTHSSKAGILGRLAAGLAGTKRIIHTVHGWSFNDYQPYFLRAAYVHLERLAGRFTHKIIVVSESDKQKGLKHSIGEEARYALIRYGIDPAEFSAPDQGLRRELGIAAEDLLVGSVACLKPQKAPQDFIRLASLVTRVVPQAKFILAGDGVLRKSIEREIDNFNLRGKVILTGWRRDIPRILAAIDVFALTSLWEGIPVSALEAMAASRPVVATDTGGIREVIVDGKTGFLVPCHDMEGMSRKVVALLQDASLRSRIGNDARVYLDNNFSAQQSAQSTQQLYGDLAYH